MTARASDQRRATSPRHTEGQRTDVARLSVSHRHGTCDSSGRISRRTAQPSAAFERVRSATRPDTQTERHRPSVVVGGGVAAVEAVHALHDLPGPRVRLTIVAPEPAFELAVEVALPSIEQLKRDAMRLDPYTPPPER